MMELNRVYSAKFTQHGISHFEGKLGTSCIYEEKENSKEYAAIFDVIEAV